MIVVDASVLAPALTDDDHAGDAARRAIAASSARFAPELIYPETLSRIRRARRARAVDDERAMRAVSRLASFHLDPHSHVPLIPRIWELRDRCSAYDATYVALAEALDLPLLTADRRLARAAAEICQVQLVSASG